MLFFSDQVTEVDDVPFFDPFEIWKLQFYRNAIKAGGCNWWSTAVWYWKKRMYENWTQLLKIFWKSHTQEAHFPP